MSEQIPINHCPKVSVVSLPSKSVTTSDGHQAALGSILYFKFGTGPAASEYAVIASQALKDTYGYKVAVVGPSGTAGWMYIEDLVQDKKEWWAFYQKRYSSTVQQETEKDDE